MSVNTLLQFLTQALFVVVFVVVAIKAVRQPQRATIDTALLFGVATLLVAEGWVIAVLSIKPGPALTALSGSLLMALPYLLLRLVNDFAGVPRPVMRVAEVGLAAATVVLVVLAGRALPGGLALPYVAYFVGLTLYGTVVVVRAAGRSGGVTRRRLQAVAAGSLCLGLTILLAGARAALPAWAAWWAVLTDLCALASGLGYFIGFAPPEWLRQAWQGPELRAFLGRAARLSHLPDTRAIVRELERGAAASLGAPAAWIGLWDEEAGVLRGDIAGEPSEVQPGEQIGGQTFAAQRAVFWADAGRADPAHADRYRARGVNAILAAPITAGEKRLGVLVAYAAQAPLFAEDDLVLLHLLADQAAVILENRVLIDEMARASRVKSEFLANMSHELRTPLNAIIGFSEVLQDGTFGSLNDRQQRYVGNVLESGQHLLGLVNDILDISKVEAGRMELHREDLDLHALLVEVRVTMLPLAQRKGVDLRVEPGDEAPLLSADRGRLVQILYNLLSNAVKFTPAGGTVRVSCQAQPDMVALAVTDTGIGIAPDDQARIFEEFQQVDSSVGRTHQGTGLGLALTRRLVELHGGTIAVHSTPGQGSTFTVLLPRAVQSVAPTHGVHGDVLVVEDNLAARELLGVYLTKAGYGMQWVEQAADVVPRARQSKPVAITLDLLLKDEMAWPVLKHLKADPQTRDIPVVIVSILDEQPTGFALGASAYLTKPLARQELLDTLQRVVAPGGPGDAEDPVRRVLAVDDQPAALELIALALEGSPYQVLPATTGVAALELLARERPDVLLVDLMMAPLSGFDVIEAAAADPQTRDIPIIVLTARDLSAEDLARLNGHVAATLSKNGFTKERFLQELHRAAQGGHVGAYCIRPAGSAHAPR